MGLALPIVVLAGYWVFEDYYSFDYEPVPRIEPGANIAAVGPSETQKVFDQDFSVRVLSLQSGRPPRWKLWAKAGPQAVTFRAFGSGGFCREFTAMQPDQVGVYPGLNEVTIRFLGIFRNKARFQISDFPKVDDGDLRIEQNQSVRVPGTDLIISVVNIHEPAPSGVGAPEPDGRTIPVVTYVAKRGSSAVAPPPASGTAPSAGEEQFANQRIGQVAHFDNVFDIEVDEILPSQAHFRVRAAAPLGLMAPGNPCTQ